MLGAYLDCLPLQNKGDKHSFFIVRALPDNYVTFESAEHTGQYLSMGKNGTAGDPRSSSASDQDAQFFVRVEVRGKEFRRKDSY